MQVITINWQEQALSVRRIVLRSGEQNYYERSADELAGDLGLEVVDDTVEPRPGDFWVGCHPRVGWGETDPALVGWASFIEVPLAVGLFRARARAAVFERATGPVPVSRASRAAFVEEPLLVAHS